MTNEENAHDIACFLSYKENDRFVYDIAYRSALEMAVRKDCERRIDILTQTDSLSTSSGFDKMKHVAEIESQMMKQLNDVVYTLSKYYLKGDEMTINIYGCEVRFKFK